MLLSRGRQRHYPSYPMKGGGMKKRDATPRYFRVLFVDRISRAFEMAAERRDELEPFVPGELNERERYANGRRRTKNPDRRRRRNKES